MRRTFFAHGRYKEAIEEADKCVKAKPDFTKGYCRAAEALTKVGQMVGFLPKNIAWCAGLLLDLRLVSSCYFLRFYSISYFNLHDSQGGATKKLLAIPKEAEISDADEKSIRELLKVAAALPTTPKEIYSVLVCPKLHWHVSCFPRQTVSSMSIVDTRGTGALRRSFRSQTHSFFATPRPTSDDSRPTIFWASASTQ